MISTTTSNLGHDQHWSLADSSFIASGQQVPAAL